tara:strand:+ start:127 stop:624 length:498 start_codon:yes stop_codon:yes gene_type:complete
MAYTFPTVELSAAPSVADTSKKYELGAIAKTEDGNVYRYVQCDVSDAVDWAVGHPVGIVSGGTSYEASADFSDITGGNCAGIATAAVDVSAFTDGTDTVYQWIQVAGSAAVTLHSGTDVTHGLHVVWHGDGTVDLLAAGEEHLSMGYCIGGSGTTSLTIQLQGML